MGVYFIEEIGFYPKGVIGPYLIGEIELYLKGEFDAKLFLSKDPSFYGLS